MFFSAEFPDTRNLHRQLLPGYPCAGADVGSIVRCWARYIQFQLPLEHVKTVGEAVHVQPTHEVLAAGLDCALR